MVEIIMYRDVIDLEVLANECASQFPEKKIDEIADAIWAYFVDTNLSDECLSSGFLRDWREVKEELDDYLLCTFVAETKKVTLHEAKVAISTNLQLI